MSTSRGKRIKSLTKDTATCVSHICYGLVELSEHLLQLEAFSYVMLGSFSTDPLEKEFSKLRQGSGGTYFIAVQQILEKVNISKAKLMLKLSETAAAELRQIKTGHCCEKCCFVLNEKMCVIMDCLPDMQASISKDSMMGLVYIAGYVTAKDKSDCDIEDSHFYYDKYGSFTEYLNRGGLHVPGDSICQWVIYSYVMFHEVANHCCRKSLCKVLQTISDLHKLNIKNTYLLRLSSIFFNNYVCSLYSPKSTKEPRQKILKLSSSNQ